MAFKRCWGSPLFLSVLLSLVSVAAVWPVYRQSDGNVVTKTYEAAAQRFQNLENPYAPAAAGADQFKYSPAFAWSYQQIMEIPLRPRLCLMAFLNSFLFFLGLSYWMQSLKIHRGFQIFVVIVALAELNTTLLYQQVNGILAGCLWLGAWFFQRRRDCYAGIAWAAGVFLKLLPVAFLGAAIWPLRKKTWLAFLAASLVLFFLPLLHVGLQKNWDLHVEWLRILGSDLGRSELMDLHTVIRKWGFPILAGLTRAVMGLITIFLFLAEPKRAAGEKRDLRPELWGLGAAALLLLSTGTESPIFILLPPAYLFLMANPKRIWAWVAVVLGWLQAVIYTDAWPRAFHFFIQDRHLSKTLAALAVWICFTWQLRDLAFKRAPAIQLPTN